MTFPLTLALSFVAFQADKSFEEATTPPSAEEKTPEKTTAGKSLAEVKATVIKEWPKIEFMKDGKAVVHQVTFDTDEGEIVVEFFPEQAPSHARSMIALTKAGFFDGLNFHRCIPGFVIQGGCPIGNGTGGPGYQVKQEFNKRADTRGTLSMARSSDPDLGGSQFFICHANAPNLDRNYTVFGKVVKGIEVVDKIVNRPRTGDKPNDPVKIKSAKASIRADAAPAAAPPASEKKAG